MVLWTVVPLEMVFPTEVSNAKYEQIQHLGVQMEVEKISDNQCRIVRILSTNPQDYLRSEIQPGTVLTYRNLYN